MRISRATALAGLIIAVGAAGGPPANSAGTATSPANPSPPPAGEPNQSISIIEALYKKGQIDSADIALGLALKSDKISTAERAHLHVLEGILRVETFQDPQASKAFTEALKLDREVEIPDFAPPRARRLFEEAKAALLPLPTEVVAPPPLPAKGVAPPPRPKKPEPPPRPISWERYYPWIAVGVGSVTALTGGGFIIASHGTDGALRSGTSRIGSSVELEAAVSRGKAFQTTGWILAGVGTAALVGGLAWRFGPEMMLFSLQLSPADGGVAVAFSGVLP